MTAIDEAKLIQFLAGRLSLEESAEFARRADDPDDPLSAQVKSYEAAVLDRRPDEWDWSVVGNELLNQASRRRASPLRLLRCLWATSPAATRRDWRGLVDRLAATWSGGEELPVRDWLRLANAARRFINQAREIHTMWTADSAVDFPTVTSETPTAQSSQEETRHSAAAPGYRERWRQLRQQDALTARSVLLIDFAARTPAEASRLLDIPENEVQAARRVGRGWLESATISGAPT